MVLANLLQLLGLSGLNLELNACVGMQDGEEGQGKHSCTHVPVLGQPVVPAHKGSG